ncbi:MAG: hypothetical protein D6719_03675 [Candidatus Dadabacteria bacterium]|nr:MAG: hypothetical protein D6719_03675 [Candidatus Dadabacteria bacterium]
MVFSLLLGCQSSAPAAKKSETQHKKGVLADYVETPLERAHGAEKRLNAHDQAVKKQAEGLFEE